MLPPSDSFVHQSQKLAEVAASIQNLGSSTVPPPPYSRTIPPVPAHKSDMDLEDDDSQYETYSSPITVHIDASVKVLGNGNTIVIPSVPGYQQQQQQQGGTAPRPTTTTTLLQSAQNHRQAKLTEMATSIIAALQNSDLLAHNRENGRRAAAIEININTGIEIEGSKNVICAGGVPGRMVAGNKNDNNGDGRKRRAQSEPADTQKAKRDCVQSGVKK